MGLARSTVVFKSPNQCHIKMHSTVLWMLLLLTHCSSMAVPPGDGLFYSDNGGFSNSCPIDTCKSDCTTGFYRSGCLGNSSGTCVQCDNAKPADSAYNTGGGLANNCGWTCNSGFTRQGSNCVSSSQCNKAGGIPANSVYSNTVFPDCQHQCNAGYFNAQASVNPTSCSTCSVGTYSLQGATVCSDCPTGTYSTVQASPNSINCLDCVAGKFSITAKASQSSVCTSCTAGTYSTTSGASSASFCQGCPAGTASPSQGANSVAVCTACDVGKFTDTVGSTDCTNCAAGTFMNVTGATKCFNCDPHTYAATTGMSACSLCEYCSKGNYRLGCGPISAGFCNACSNTLVN